MGNVELARKVVSIVQRDRKSCSRRLSLGFRLTRRSARAESDLLLARSHCPTIRSTSPGGRASGGP